MTTKPTLTSSILSKIFIKILDGNTDLCVMAILINGLHYTVIFSLTDLTFTESQIRFTLNRGTMVNTESNNLYRFGAGKDIDVDALPGLNPIVNDISFTNPIVFDFNGSVLMINSQEVGCVVAYATGGGLSDEVSLILDSNYNIEFIID